MKIAVLLATLSLCFVFAEPAAAAPGVSPWNSGCNHLYTQYKKKPKHKAFTVVRDTSSESCAITWGAPSQKEAEERAKQWCKKNAQGAGSCTVTKSE